MSEYPEHEKLMAVNDQSQAIGEFLDFGLSSMGIVLAEVSYEYHEPRLMATSRSIETILAEYFEIDRDALEREKRAILNEIRKTNA